MDRPYKQRLAMLRKDAELDPVVLKDLVPRLSIFLEPFIAGLGLEAQRKNARHYAAGLLSDLEDKNVESIAYLHGEERQALQKFIGQGLWDHHPMLTTLVRQVGQELGEADGVIVFDPSAFAKKGNASVGVGRQWCGRLGKIDNCQVGIYMGYVSRIEQALVDCRLYLPKDWANDRKRRRKAGVPKEVKFKTRHELALEMLDENTALLPHAWVAGDDEMGRSSRFRQALREREEHYLLCVPSNTLIRDLSAPPPPYSGHGRHPAVPWQRVDKWAAALPTDAWQEIDVRDGEKGPLLVQAAKVRVQARTEKRQTGPEEALVVFRTQQEDGSWKHDYTLSNGSLATPLAEFARVFCAEHRIEQCLQRAKGEAGLADYEVRTWRGWHHHQALSLIATWFLIRETRQGKKIHPSTDRTAAALGDCPFAQQSFGLRSANVPDPDHHQAPATHRGSAVLSLQET